MDVINTSKEWKTRADNLLVEKGLIDDLSKFGDIHFTGAYSYDLMMHGDIDMSVVREKAFSVGEVLEIFKYLYLKGKLRSYFIGGDWDDPRKGAEFPRGYYVGLKEKVSGERWKFDLWFLSKEEFEKRSDNSELKSLTEAQKKLILECKQVRNENKLPVTGQEIYDLVLNGRVGNAEDLKSLI
jgi:hypothetical protein